MLVMRQPSLLLLAMECQKREIMAMGVSIFASYLGITVFIGSRQRQNAHSCLGRRKRGPLPDIYLCSRDLDQADIAPLMATLIDIERSANSVGVLPVVDST